MEVSAHDVMRLAADRRNVAANGAQVARLIGVAGLLFNRFGSGGDGHRLGYGARPDLRGVDLLALRPVKVALHAAVGGPYRPQVSRRVPGRVHASARPPFAVRKRERLDPTVAIQPGDR